VCDKARSGRQVIATGESHQGRVEDMIQENCLDFDL